MSDCRLVRLTGILVVLFGTTAINENAAYAVVKVCCSPSGECTETGDGDPEPCSIQCCDLCNWAGGDTCEVGPCTSPKPCCFLTEPYCIMMDPVCCDAQDGEVRNAASCELAGCDIAMGRDSEAENSGAEISDADSQVRESRVAAVQRAPTVETPAESTNWMPYVVVGVLLFAALPLIRLERRRGTA